MKCGSVLCWGYPLLQRSNHVIWVYICGVVLEILTSILFFHIEDLSLNGTPSQSSDYYWMRKKVNLTADIAISGEADDTFIDVACSVTLATPPQSVAF